MENQKLIQIFFDGLMCFVDIENKAVYSAKLHKMKPQHMKRHLGDYYMIKYNGKKKYMTFDQLFYLAIKKDEKL